MTSTSPVTLEEAKRHLRVETTQEDLLVSTYLLAAAQWFEAETGSSFADLDPVPQLVKQCLLMLVAHWFETREGTSTLPVKPVPLAVESIVAQYATPQAI